MLRKVSIALAVVAALFVALGIFAWWRVGHLDVQQITPDVWMLTGIGGNVGVLRTTQGAVVVDTMTFPRQGREILDKAVELTGKPVAAIFNTHYHPDHTHGNPAFPPRTRVVATRRTRQHLEERDADFWRDSPARDLLPNETFTDTHELRLGGKTVRALHTGRGHTDGDLSVVFVEDRVLHTGDLLFHGHYPNIDLEAGGSVRDWPTTLQVLLDNVDFAHVIPGHGPLGDPQSVESFRDFMIALWTQTSAIAKRGGTLEEAEAEVELDRFGLTPLWYVPTLNRSFVIGRAFEEARANPES
jgi:glyoxylase-like metal-dependent hydrolase (beta-lactamase superfamily II)